MNNTTQTPHQVSICYASIAGWYSGMGETCSFRIADIRKKLENVEMDKWEKSSILLLLESMSETIASAQRHEAEQREAAGLSKMNR